MKAEKDRIDSLAFILQNAYNLASAVDLAYPDGCSGHEITVGGAIDLVLEEIAPDSFNDKDNSGYCNDWLYHEADEMPLDDCPNESFERCRKLVIKAKNNYKDYCDHHQKEKV
jgi:hypothetical protein